MCNVGKILSYSILFITIAALVTTITGCESRETVQKEELKATIKRIIEEAWNNGNLDVLDELYAVDFVRHRPPFPDIEGLDAHKQRVSVVRSAYPDHKTIIHDIIVDGDKVALWYTWEGTHTGEGLSLPPTGKPVKVAGCDVYHMVDGKVVEEWDHEGFLSLFQQLGYKIIPPQELSED